MCLDTVDEKPKRKQGDGWKCFTIDWEYHLHHLHMSGGRLPIGKWITDKNSGPIPSVLGPRYGPGFHLYIARPLYYGRNTLRRVSFRNVVATGRQGDRKVIVAREIYIHPKERKGAKE